MKFKKIDVGDAAQAIGTIGVIAGIIFLAYELRQNNEFLEAEASFNLAQNRISMFETLSTDDDLATALLTGLKGEPLSDLQEFQLQLIYVQIFTKWDWEYQQYRQGRIAEQQLPVSDWIHILKTFPGMREHWDTEKAHGRTPEFVKFMEEEVADQ